MYKKSLYLLLILPLFLTGCFPEEESDDGDIEGAWASSCQLDGTTNSKTQQLTADAGSFNMSMQMFEDTSCYTSGMNMDMSGGYSKGATSVTAFGEDVREIDVVVNSAVVTVFSQGFVDHFNQEAACGITWTLGTPTDVLGCDYFTPAAIYDIYRVEDGRLYFGDDQTGDASSPATRPTALSMDYMIRQ